MGTVDRYMSVTELFEEYGIPRRTIYEAIERGDMVAFTPNGCKNGRRVRRSEFERWCRACESKREG